MNKLTSMVWSGTPTGFAWLGNIFNAFAIKWDLPDLETISKSYSKNNNNT
jgi:hypothetical protein